MPEALEVLKTALQGRYTITRELGRGGMATVYLAHDLKHDRDVAIKVLHEDLGATLGPGRFLAEIKTTAKLQHPHILPLLDSGEASGLLFYVMPYVAGDTLRDRLTRETQLPIEDAVRIAREVADALGHAHGHGIVHRDIKPENILLQGGHALVADFGIALAVQHAGGARLTQTGLSLGTPQYMAPEQAMGEKTVGPAADIYALGAVTYEMLTGEPPFTGATVQAIVSKVLSAQPERPTMVRNTIPQGVEAATLKALAKLPADRFASAGAFADALQRPEFAGSKAIDAPKVQRGVLQGVGLLSAGLAAGALVATWLLSGGDRRQATPDYLPLSTPPGVELTTDCCEVNLALSSDGRRVVFLGTAAGVARLYLQDLSKPDYASPIAGTEGAGAPFFSPDGNSLGFEAAGSIQVVRLDGGAPRKLASIGSSLGGTWSPDGDTVYFADFDSGIWKVPAAGGTPTNVTKPRKDGFDNSHAYPELLPGGRKLLYTSAYGRFRLVALDLATGKTTTILENETAFFGRFVAPGYIMFAQTGAVMAATFDPATLKVGTPFAVLKDAVIGSESEAQFAVSPGGSLIYLRGSSAYERTLSRIDRDGTRRPLDTDGPKPFSLTMSASPEGGRLAVSLARGGQQDLFVYDIARQDLRQIVNEPHNDFWPVWSRDGRSVAFTSVRSGILDLYVAPVDRTSEGKKLWSSPRSKYASSWSPGDTLLAFTELSPVTGDDIWIYSTHADSARPLIAEPGRQANAVFSPDGNWIAFERDETPGDVWVRPFPAPGPECKISKAGGADPAWSRDGAELYYRRNNTLMVADVRARNFCTAVSRALFDGLEPAMWAPFTDGKFFVTVDVPVAPRLWLVRNWTRVLQNLTAAK